MSNQRYTPEFKDEAVRQIIERELGIKRNQLYKWQDEVHAKGEGAFPGRGRQAPAEAELAHLKRENERLKEENEILKKAAKYFARESE